MFKEVLTDPKKHNPEYFIYLVHGILAVEGTDLKIEEKLKDVKTQGRFFRASLIGKMSKESAKKIGWDVFKEQDISQLITFGAIGFIIEPFNDEVIKIAWNADIGSPRDQESLRKFVAKHKFKIKNPYELLTSTPDGLHNELILEGHQGNAIRGIFVVEGYERSKANLEALEALTTLISEEMKVKASEIPVIKLPRPIFSQQVFSSSVKGTINYYLEFLSYNSLRIYEWTV
jgi:hypothetical protein